MARSLYLLSAAVGAAASAADGQTITRSKTQRPEGEKIKLVGRVGLHSAPLFFPFSFFDAFLPRGAGHSQPINHGDNKCSDICHAAADG